MKVTSHYHVHSSSALQNPRLPALPQSATSMWQDQTFPPQVRLSFAPRKITSSVPPLPATAGPQAGTMVVVEPAQPAWTVFSLEEKLAKVLLEAATTPTRSGEPPIADDLADELKVNLMVAVDGWVGEI